MKGWCLLLILAVLAPVTSQRTVVEVVKKVLVDAFRALSSTYHHVAKVVSRVSTRLREWSERDGWACGADKFWGTKWLAKTLARATCPALIDKLNALCIDHDNCYTHKRGREYCDDRFCDSLDGLSINSTNEDEDCQLPITMCEAVRLGGFIAYPAEK